LDCPNFNDAEIDKHRDSPSRHRKKENRDLRGMNIKKPVIFLAKYTFLILFLGLLAAVLYAAQLLRR